MTATESFHAWLIRQRIYCEYNALHTLCVDRSTTVRNFNGKDIVLCQEHAARLDAVRLSEIKQDEPEVWGKTMKWLKEQSERNQIPNERHESTTTS